MTVRHFKSRDKAKVRSGVKHEYDRYMVEKEYHKPTGLGCAFREMSVYLCRYILSADLYRLEREKRSSKIDKIISIPCWIKRHNNTCKILQVKEGTD